MAQSFELGQLANVISVDDFNSSVGIGTSVNITGILSATQITTGSLSSIETTSGTISATQLNVSGVITATSFVGDGSGLSNAGATLSDGSESQRVVLTSLSSGSLTSAATTSSLTYNSSTGILSATSFVGDGSQLTGIIAGATLNESSGSQRVVLTSLTSGSMLSAATSSSLTYDSSTGSLSATKFVGDGSGLSNAGASLSVGIGTTMKVLLTDNTTGILTAPATTSRLTYNAVRNELSTNLVGNVTGVSTFYTDIYVDRSPGGGNPTYMTFTGNGYTGTEQDPNMYLIRGAKYRFINRTGLDFRIVTAPGNSGIAPVNYSTGVTNNGNEFGTQHSNPANGNIITWDVRYDAPAALYAVLDNGNGFTYAQFTTRFCIFDPLQLMNAAGNIIGSASSITSQGITYNNGVRITPNGSNGRVDINMARDGFVNFSTLALSSAVGGTYSSQYDCRFKLFGDNILIGATVTYGVGGSLTNASYQGLRNVMIGNDAGERCAATSGSNCYYGYRAGAFMTGGTNVAIGREAGHPDTLDSGSNCTIIGYQAYKTLNASNEITLGNNYITTLRCQVTTITALSDRRDKTNIENIPVGLNYINALRPVKFDWNRRDGSYNGKKSFGFVAQELEEVQNQFGYKEYTNLVYDLDPDRLEATPLNTYPILVKAVQELSQQNKELLQRIEELEKKLNG